MSEKCVKYVGIKKKLYPTRNYVTVSMYGCGLVEQPTENNLHPSKAHCNSYFNF